MFQRITIQLSSPICGCKSQDLGWSIYIEKTGRPGLRIACGSCDTQLIVGSPHFKAAFELDEDYPDGKIEKKDAQILKLAPPPPTAQEE